MTWPTMCSSATLCCANLAVRLDDRQAEILDWGCRDGEVGTRLCALGYRTVDGMDTVFGMLSRARQRGVYRRLFSAASPDELPDRSYDAVVASRSLAGEDASPDTVHGFVRLLKPGGVMSLAIAPRGGLEETCLRLCRTGTLLKMEETWDTLAATGELQVRFLVLGRF